MDARSMLSGHHYDELWAGGWGGMGAGCHRHLCGMVAGSRMWNFCYHAAKRKPGILSTVLRVAFLAARGRQLPGTTSPHSGRTITDKHGLISPHSKPSLHKRWRQPDTGHSNPSQMSLLLPGGCIGPGTCLEKRRGWDDRDHSKVPRLGDAVGCPVTPSVEG